MTATASAGSEEHDELRRSVRRFLEDRSPSSEVRRLMETTDGYDAGVWRAMTAELGLQGLVIPETLGGSGRGFPELAVVLEEMGRSLLCAPYFSTVALATTAILASGDTVAQEELLPDIAGGRTIATLALAEDSGRWDPTDITVEATRSEDGHTLEGHKTFVTDGHTAGLILVAARAGADVGLFAVDGDAPGLTRRPLPTMDLTRRQARLELAATPARRIGGEGDGAAALSTTLDLAAVALAAEQVGGAQRCLEMSVQHAKERVQFGRPVGSFQAVKHKCAEMLLRVEQARSAAWYAAWAATESSEELAGAAPVAKAYCSDAYFHTAAETIQVHGAVGFTWDHDAQLHFRRAKSSQVLLGHPAHHRELLARRLGL